MLACVMAGKQQKTEEVDLRPIHEPSLGYAKDCFAATEVPFLFAPNLDSGKSVIETETESDDEDYLAGLIQSMAHSFLEDDADNHSNEGVETKDYGLAAEATMTVSPQSTLSSYLSTSEKSSPAINFTPVDASPLFSTPDKPKEDKDQEQVVDIDISKPVCEANSVVSNNTVKSPARSNPWQTAQKPQSQTNSAWAVQNKEKTGGLRTHGTLGLPSSAWPPLQKQPKQQKLQSKEPLSNPIHNSEMRTLFLRSSGPKRESIGTGVFIPRIPSTVAVPRRKPACSMVLVPARVVQALNLNLDEFGTQPRFTNDGTCAGYVLNQEALLNRSTSTPSSCEKTKVPCRPQSPDIPSPYLHLLPQEWTY